MPAPFSGGCLCGAIRYESRAEPLFSINCHCRDCQRTTGTAYAPVLAVPRDALSTTQGEPTYYTSQSDSGETVSRGFCPECGSGIFSKLSANPDIVGLKAASLDDPSWFRPAMDIYTDSAQPWDVMNPDLPKVPKMPQM
ncbi:MAG: GFA family protein [Desulfurellaceae bacterium]|nr:GFA family protein [Desulfurellaceae bacterium]